VAPGHAITLLLLLVLLPGRWVALQDVPCCCIISRPVALHGYLLLLLSVIDVLQGRTA
jgi:hypothetical protein